MPDQVASEVNASADLARLRGEGQLLSSQELEELNARAKALEEMACLEDWLKALENENVRGQLLLKTNLTINLTLIMPVANRQGSESQPPAIQPTIESDDLQSSSSDTVQHWHKRQRYSRGIKITPSYTLRISSSLRE